jgi:integrase
MPALERDELARLLAAVDRSTLMGRRDYAILSFLLDSLWPFQQALKLRWGDLQVSRDGAACQRPPFARRPKNPARRIVTPLAWKTWGAMVDYLDAAGRLPGMQPQDYVFTRLIDATGAALRQFGDDWNQQPLADLRWLLQHAGKRAGLPRWKITPHNLRRSAALIRWQDGAPLEEIMHRLDFISTVTALRFLDHADAGDAEQG